MIRQILSGIADLAFWTALLAAAFCALTNAYAFVVTLVLVLIFCAYGLTGE